MSNLAVGILAASFVVAISVSPAGAVNTITFGANSAHCGGSALCSSDGTHGYLANGKGQAFKASAIRKWFQIDADGKSYLKGQGALPLRGSGSFVVVNDTGRPITKFALRIKTDNKACAKNAPCSGFTAQGGTGAFRFNAMLASRDGRKCTQGKAMLRDICVGDPVSASFASNNVLYSWTAKPQGAIPKGAYFTITFSGWTSSAWAAPPDSPLIVMLSETSDGTPGNAPSYVSATGQSWTLDSSNVVFYSDASNLPGGSSSNATLYIYNVPSGILLPIATPLPNNVESIGMSISGNGALVGYTGEPNLAYNNYLYDVASQTTQTVLSGA